MILWLALFIIIVAISFLLAYQSMKDFAEKPSGKDGYYGLFLIKNPSFLTTELLDSLHSLVLKTGEIITLEKLTKGSKTALVIFGPRAYLEPIRELDLLEIEEYSKVDPSLIVAFEVGSKDPVSLHFGKVEINLPPLHESEQVWWQLTLQAKSGPLWPNRNRIKELVTGSENYDMNLRKITQSPELKMIAEEKNKQKIYQVQIRVVVFAANAERRASIAAQLENIDGGKLIKVPRPYSQAQILTGYQERLKISGGIGSLVLTSEEILNFAGFKA